MTYKELKESVDVLLMLLDYDLNTSVINAHEDEMDLRSKLAFECGVYEDCICQAKRHIAQFKEGMVNDE